jgi:hypothetical protein
MEAQALHGGICIIYPRAFPSIEAELTSDVLVRRPLDAVHYDEVRAALVFVESQLEPSVQ